MSGANQRGSRDELHQRDGTKARTACTPITTASCAGFARRRFEQRLRSLEARAAARARISLAGLGSLALRELDAGVGSGPLGSTSPCGCQGSTRSASRGAPGNRGWLAWLAGPGRCALAGRGWRRSALVYRGVVRGAGDAARRATMRWLDTAEAGSVMVFEADAEADMTIIWMLDDVAEGAARGGSDVRWL